MVNKSISMHACKSNPPFLQSAKAIPMIFSNTFLKRMKRILGKTAFQKRFVF